ncbi:MAG: ABC transporter substrate-binding protein [Archaeoglobaceae archaeon]
MKYTFILLLLLIPLSFGISSASTSREYIELFFSDDRIDNEELLNSITAYMLNEDYRGKNLKLEWLRDASYVYVYWGGNPKTFEDVNGNQLKIYKPIKKIVTYHHQHAEMLMILGLEDKVVGVRDTFAIQKNRYPILHTKPSVGSGDSPDYEKIIELDPDVVIAYGWYPAVGTIERLSDLPDRVITIMRVGFTGDPIGKGYVGIDAMKKEVLDFASLFDQEVMKRAQKYLEWHDRYINIVLERVSKIPENEKLKVFVESSEGSYGRSNTRLGIGLGHPAHGLVELAGGKNIGAGNIPFNPTYNTEYNDISVEFVLENNPDIIVGRAMGTISGQGALRPWERTDDGAVKAYYNDIKNVFYLTNAVRNDRVYVITNDWAITPNYPSALVALAKWFYPELFADLDPCKTFEEYVDLLGVSKAVLNHRSFTYPAICI